MLKKFFTGLMAAGMLLATSCQEQEFTPALGEATVTFEVATPEIATRAYSDGMTANKLQYAVYHNGVKSNLQCDPVEVKNGTASFSQSLTAGETYTIILWADYDDKNDQTVAPYAVTFANKIADAKMEVNYTGVKSNDEKLDAFYAVKVIEVKGTQTETVELKRPFAQLNIGTNDYAKAEAASGYVPNQSSVTVKGIYNTLNLADGTVSGNADVTFGLAAIDKTEAFPYDDTNYDYVAMNYVLVDKSLVEVEFAVAEGAEDNIVNPKTRTVASVPVQRNYRTNIYGSILTSDVDVNVEIKPGYNEPANELDDLYKAALNGGEVTLTEDVVLTSPLEVYSEMIINLNGKTISSPSTYAIENYGTLTIKGDGNLQGLGGIRSHGGKIIIDGGAFTCTSDWNVGTYNHIMKAQNTEVVINGGNFDATVGGTTNAMINVSENSIVTINGGTFKNVNGVIPQFAPYMFTYEKNGKLIINGGDFYGGWRFNGETATTDIYGGTFTVSYDGQSFHAASTHVVTIYGGAFSLENGAKLNPTNHVATGYKAVEIDGLYHVLPEVVADAAVTAGVTSVTENTADVATALAANNGEATMFMWNDVAYIAKYQEVVIASSVDEATTSRGVVEGAAGLISATVNEGIEVVGNRTFRKCANLETVELPSSLTEIGPAVFQSCSKLANVTIPASVTTIGEGAFAECTSLTSINIPEGITRLEKDVLRNTGLVSIEIPASVNYIGTYAFRDCESLTEVKILSPEFTIENNTFTNIAAPVPTMKIYVVNAEMKAYLDSVLTNYDKSYITVEVM